MGVVENEYLTAHPLPSPPPDIEALTRTARRSGILFSPPGPRANGRTKAYAADAQRSIFDALGRLLAKRQEQLARLPPEIRFLWRHGVPLARLEAAQKRAELIGVEAHEALIASGLMSESHYLDRLAEETGCQRLVETDALDQREPLSRILSYDMALLALNEAKVYAVLPTVTTIRWLLAAGGRNRLRLATRAEFQALLLRDQQKAVLAEATELRLARQGHRSAKEGVSISQALAALVLFAALSAGLCFAFAETLAVVTLGLSLVFLATNVLQSAALFMHRSKAEPAAALSDAELPVYSVLVALYKEERIVPRLLAALEALDYPAEKLDIKLILESHDEATRKTVEAVVLPPQFSLVICPPGAIMTKPRAMSIGLLTARGSLVTVFDAEDVPKPDQLRIAANRFAQAPESVGCLQASLRPDNADKGLLQAMFALEYASLFDVTRSGWCRLGLPMPLGGTSNHFRLKTLAELGGWDAYNVTEDAELGLRLGRLGYSIETLPSQTDEEAPGTFRSWFDQRRRWCKGWVQTTVMLLHAPMASLRAQGVAYALSVFIMISTLLSLLLYPAGVFAVAWRASFGEPFFSGSLLARLSDGAALLVIFLSLGNAYATALVATAKRRLKRNLACLPLIPFYYLAISVASWVSLYDFMKRPFHWLKTEHGADQPPVVARRAANDNARPLRPIVRTTPEARLFARNRYSAPRPQVLKTARSRIATTATP